MYATKFGESGDDVVVAKNGTDALRKLEQEGPFDGVLLDLVMPGLSGMDIIKEINSSDTFKDTKCIVLSNQGEESDIEEATQIGALGYIVKAESIPSEVVERVHEILKN